MRIILLIITSFLIFSSLSVAQNRLVSISGYVREKGTDETLVGAVVRSQSGVITSTNHAGYFQLKLNEGEHKIITSYMGYENDTTEVTVAANLTQNFWLVPAVVSIKEVVVTARPNIMDSGSLGSMTVGMSQIKFAPLFLGERDVIKYIQNLPGVSQGKEGSSQMAVRGGGGDQTLIMLDEVPIYNQNHTFGLLSIFNGDVLSNAQIHKGHIPAPYGGRLSSVLSLQMREGNKQEHHQSITLGTMTIGAMLEGPIKRGKGSYIVSERRFLPDLFLRAFYALKDDNSLKILYSFYDVSAKVNYDIGTKNRLYYSIYSGRDAFSSTDQGSERRDDNPEFKLFETGTGFRWGNLASSIRLNTVLDNGTFMNNSIYFSSLKNYQKDFFERFDVENSKKSETTSTLEEYGIRSTTEQQIGASNLLKYGLNASMQFLSPQKIVTTQNGIVNCRDFSQMRLYTGTLFAEDEISLGALKLDVGARLTMYNNEKRSEFIFEPRLGVNYRFDQNNSAWAGYTVSSQAIFAASQFSTMRMPMEFWLPYGDQGVQRSWQANVGWKNLSLRNTVFTVEAYYKRLKNMLLIYSTDEYLAGGADIILASGYAYGAEFTAQYSRGRFSGLMGYTYSRSFRKSEGVTYPYVYDAPHRLNLMGNFTTVQRKGRKHTFSLIANFQTGLPYTMANGMYYPSEDSFVNSGGGYNPIEIKPDPILDYPKYPNTRLPNYFRTDISYSMERQKKRGSRTWQFSILNVTGHTNPYMIHYKFGDYRSTTLIPIMPSVSYKRTF